MFKLRPYQSEARDAILREWADGRKKTLLVLPTGTGKTVVFAKVVEHQVMRGGRALIMAHRGELLTQASDKIYEASGLQTALEKADSTNAVQRIAFEMDMYELVAWIEDHKKEYASFILYGDQDEE